jgi:hypothetical protein
MTGMQSRGAAAFQDGSSQDGSSQDGSSHGIAATLFFYLPLLVLSLCFSCGMEDGAAINNAEDTGQPVAVAKAISPQQDASTRQPGTAVLAEGSRIVVGLPGFGRNALPALYGEYAITVADGVRVRVPVWFTREVLVLPSAWKKAPCRSMTAGFSALYAPAEADGSALWTLSTSDYHLFVSVPKEMSDPCAFMSKFSDRFSFFYRYAAQQEDISFPAILELDV